MQPVSTRLYSLDALRGFDMFWIMGAEEVIHAISHVTQNPIIHVIDNQFNHVVWNGFRFYDLIFPLFLFISGVSTPYSVGRELEKNEAKSKIAMKIIKRSLILVFLGIIYNLHGFQLKPLAEIRFPSVLGRIGLAYMFACIIYVYASQKFQYIWFGGVLVFYALLLHFSSAPGFPTGDLTMEGNIVSWLDRTILPGRLHRKIHDPEGLFSTIPAIGTGLLGIFAGNLLKNGNYLPTRKATILAIGGLICLGISSIWNNWLPINKQLWTSSFVLHAGGWSLLLLSLFYYVIDVLNYRKWAFFFTVIGMNSILIYMSDVFIDWWFTSGRVFDWIGKLLGEHSYEIVLITGVVVLKWIFLRFLYEKKIFLKV